MNIALITAAGIGKRMNSPLNKIFMMLDSEKVLELTLAVFQKCSSIDKMMVVAREQDKAEIEKLKERFPKIEKVVVGGEKRQNSVYNGLVSLDAHADDIIVIHNGVNPFVDEKTIVESIDAAKKYEAAVVGYKARDTVKEVDEKGFIVKTLDRKRLWQVQTPQTIRYGTAIKAFRKAFDEEFFGTDDTMLVERLGKKVKMIECSPENIKITLPQDIEFGNKLLKHSRIGFGMDSHRFVKEGEKKLILGGVEFEGKGFDANSDGDVILHALFNAISQGLGEKSLGHYADDMFEKGVTDSKEYLNVALKMMKDREYALGNIGIMLEGKMPKISGHEEKLKESLSSLLGIEKDSVGVTATSGEDLSAFGRGLGMQCFCVVSMHKK